MLNENIVWIWNVIGKCKGVWVLFEDVLEVCEGFFLNYFIYEFLLFKGDGFRWVNLDLIIG